MAQRPFDLAETTYPGTARPWNPRRPQRSFWLGRGARMVQLPFPSLGYTVMHSQGETLHQLPGGGVTVTRRPGVRRSWELKWPRLTGRDWSLVNGFYLRSFGRGPWCFLNPEGTNRLTYGQSMCGAANAVVDGWAALTGAVAYASDVQSPFDPCGVLRWTGAGSGSLLVAGLNAAGSPSIDPTVAMPYVPAEPVSGSAWLSLATGTASAQVGVIGFAADGVTVVASTFSDTVALTSTPQPVTVTDAPGALGASVWTALAVKSLTASAPALLATAPQLRETGIDPDAWDLGGGVARVIWPAGLSQDVDGTFASAPTMNLAEVA